MEEVKKYKPRKPPKKANNKLGDKAKESGALSGFLGGIEEAKGNAGDTAKHTALQIVSLGAGMVLGAALGKKLSLVVGLAEVAVGLYKGSSALSTAGLGTIAGGLIRPEEEAQKSIEASSDAKLIEKEKTRAVASIQTLGARVKENLFLDEAFKLIPGSGSDSSTDAKSKENENAQVESGKDESSKSRQETALVPTPSSLSEVKMKGEEEERPSQVKDLGRVPYYSPSSPSSFQELMPELAYEDSFLSSSDDIVADAFSLSGSSSNYAYP